MTLESLANIKDISYGQRFSSLHSSVIFSVVTGLKECSFSSTLLVAGEGLSLFFRLLKKSQALSSFRALQYSANSPLLLRAAPGWRHIHFLPIISTALKLTSCFSLISNRVSMDRIFFSLRRKSPYYKKVKKY